MPEDVTQLLKTFTPTSPDRDALLFAAGRAAAKPSPFWKAACGLLAATQFVTLGLWLTRPATPSTAPAASLPTESSDPPTGGFVEPYSYLALARETNFDRFTPTTGLPPATPAKPLTAGAWRDIPQ